MMMVDRFQFKVWVWLVFSFFLNGLVLGGNASGTTSKWDKDLLSVKLINVEIHANTMLGAWEEMSTRYLLRANFYIDNFTDDAQKPFTFRKTETSGQELFAAFLEAYPALTYTQNPGTGIIWFYPKYIDYGDLLGRRVDVVRSVKQIPMYTGIYSPLCKLLGPQIIDSSIMPGTQGFLLTGKPSVPTYWLYDIDLPAGTYSVRELLDICCLGNPSKAFIIEPISKVRKKLISEGARFMIVRRTLTSDSPITPPPTEAISFWEIGIGKPINGIPSFGEVREAMSDPNSMKRKAASSYLELASLNYSPLGLIGKAESADQAVWTAFGVGYALFRDCDTNLFITLAPEIPRLREDLRNIQNPCLALLASLQLTKEKQDTSYLDNIIRKHIYNEDEITSISPELTRMARSSKAVRDKLLAMKSILPELSPEALSDLANTNSFLTLPQDDK
jgi:hypothetical protein